jgi:hypothetical protein
MITNYAELGINSWPKLPTTHQCDADKGAFNEQHSKIMDIQVKPNRPVTF